MLVSLGWIAAVLRLVFPAPTTADGWILWGWNYDQWSDFQFGCLCTLGLCVLIHVMLHWNWVCSVVTVQILKSRQRIDDSMQTIYGVGVLLLLLHLIGAGVIAAMYSVQRPPIQVSSESIGRSLVFRIEESISVASAAGVRSPEARLEHESALRSTFVFCA